jgi:hypothetical protein
MTIHSLEDRRLNHIALAEKADARAIGHRANADLQARKGKTDKAADFTARAERQELIAKEHRRDAGRLQVKEEARAKGRVIARTLEIRTEERMAATPRPDPLQIYMEALQHAEELDAEVEGFRLKRDGYARQGEHHKAGLIEARAQKHAGWALEWRAEVEKAIALGEGRDLAKEREMALKAQAKQVKLSTKEEKRLANLKIAGDLRTAAGQREFVSGGIGKGKVASLSAYIGLIRRPQDRTAPRLDAMRFLDDLCGTADSGLFPEPKFAQESRGSGFGPGPLIMLERAAGLAEVDTIKGTIGARNFEMLKAWIYEKQTLTALVRSGYGTEKTAGALALAAVDALVLYLKTRSGRGSPRDSGRDTGRARRYEDSPGA